MAATLPIHTAQYLRMSSDEQKLSLAIRRHHCEYL